MNGALVPTEFPMGISILVLILMVNTCECFTSSPASYARRIPAVQEPGTEPGAVLPAAPQNMKPSVKLTDTITCQDWSADTRDSREAA